jgi:hypothetical protein
VAAVKRIVGISDPLQALMAERVHNDGWSGAIASQDVDGV